MEEYLVIDAADEGELMEELQQYSTDTLKIAARCISRLINNKLHGNPLYGAWYKEKQHTDEPANADWEHQSDWTIIDDVVVNDTFTVECIYRAKEALERANVPSPHYLIKGYDEPTEQWDIETEETYSNKWTYTMQTNSINDLNFTTPISFDNLPCPAPMTVKQAFTNNYGAGFFKKAKEQTMNCYQTPAYNEVQQAKQHLTRRVDEVYYSYGDKLFGTFNMRNTTPKNVKQAKDWLARGGMVVTNDNDESSYVDVRWQDPDKPRNEAGFKAAQLLLGKDYQNAKDAILVKNPEDGLKALQDFETRTYN